mmetsp:Transcript_91524/g.222261  ORF Transcript_91524/g.222261 Transcript_91524/m.222261 type:complete len:269 (+) Transcript_91524:305-1111(+)
MQDLVFCGGLERCRIHSIAVSPTCGGISDAMFGARLAHQLPSNLRALHNSFAVCKQIVCDTCSELSRALKLNAKGFCRGRVHVAGQDEKTAAHPELENRVTEIWYLYPILLLFRKLPRLQRGHMKWKRSSLRTCNLGAPLRLTNDHLRVVGLAAELHSSQVPRHQLGRSHEEGKETGDLMQIVDCQPNLGRQLRKHSVIVDDVERVRPINGTPDNVVHGETFRKHEPAEGLPRLPSFEHGASARRREQRRESVAVAAELVDRVELLDK